jgi:chromate reductase
MPYKNFVGISGSLRYNSSNTGMLRTIQAAGPQNGYTLTILNYTDVPHYDQDIEDSGNPDSVNNIRAIISSADGVIIACPEYNGWPSGALKNLIDWGTRKINIWLNKPCLIISAGGTYGGIRASNHLTDLLTDIKAKVMPDQGIHVNLFAKPPFVDYATGKVTSTDLVQNLEAVTQAFVSWDP